jgi:hypothetical protein
MCSALLTRNSKEGGAADSAISHRPVETESGVLFNIPSCFQLGGG